jgi:hypothetical protein
VIIRQKVYLLRIVQKIPLILKGLELVLLVTVYDDHYNKWVLVTACTFHMSLKRDWFANYELVNGGSVLMGNNVTCKIIGIGTVRIRMHDVVTNAEFQDQQ